jgi:leader peptidase (prepilin peptidase)/N-methyltransferase
VVLAPTLGLVLGRIGWGASAIGLVAGFVLGLIAAAALLIAGRVGADRALAFGPFMLFGA